MLAMEQLFYLAYMSMQWLLILKALSQLYVGTVPLE